MPSRDGSAPAPAPELTALLATRAPAVAGLALAARALALEEAPGADELVYDAYNAVSVAFSHTGRLGGAFCHVAAYAGHVNLGFNRGAELPDPARLLRGSGRLIRHVRLGGPADLEEPALRALVRAAVAHAAARNGMAEAALHGPPAAQARPSARGRRLPPDRTE